MPNDMLPSRFFDMGQKVHSVQNSQTSESHSFVTSHWISLPIYSLLPVKLHFLSVNKTIFDHFDGLTPQLLVEPNFLVQVWEDVRD